MNILILGASGFIGRNMMEYFARDKENNILAHCKSRVLQNTPENVKVIQYDLTTEANVAVMFGVADNYFKDITEKGIDIVIQAAATTSGAKDTFTKPYYHVTDNAVMNSLILREELKYNIKHHIFFSCTVMYSSQHGVVTEDTVINEIQPRYFGVGWTKVYLEKMCKFYSSISKTKFTVIRHTNIFGPYDKYDLENSHFFGATVTKVINTKDGEAITVWGDGQDKRDFLQVDDLCEFVESAISMQKSNYELVNVGSGLEYTTNEIVEKIAIAAKKNLKIVNDVTKPSIPIDFSISCKKAFDMFNWSPRITIDEGIQETIRWYKSFFGK
jgi:GDP-L-fucose synthase